MKKNIYKVGLALAILGITATPSFAALRYSLEEFEQDSSKLTIGPVNVGGGSFFRIGTSNDFNLGPLDLGIDINGYIPLSGIGHYPTDFQGLTLRSLSYKHNNDAGIKFGRLNKVTYGYGLLMDGYDSGMGGETSIFTTQKGGFQGYLNAFGVRADALGTFGSVYAGRLSYEVPEITLFGTPVVLGATYATDQDGLSYAVNGGKVTRKPIRGFGADVGLPIAGDFLTAYVEYAALNDHAHGMSSGIKGDFLSVVTYKMEYQALQKGFVPGYFNTTYEATSFDFDKDAPKSAINGWIGNLSVAIPSAPFRGGIQFESYSDRHLLTGAVGWTNIANTTGVINYTQPFQNASNPTLESTILYQPGGWIDYVTRYKRVYYSGGTYTESYDVGLRMNPEKLFPKLF